MNSLKKALESRVTISDCFNWTYSIVCLFWMKSFDKEYKTFAQNRLNEIRELSNIQYWNHVKNNSDPAEILTKFSTYLFRSKSFWLEGPQFFKKTMYRIIFTQTCYLRMNQMS